MKKSTFALWSLCAALFPSLVEAAPARIWLSASALSSTHQLVGPLGVPLGQPILVEGLLQSGRHKGRTDFFAIEKLNGKSLQKPIRMYYHFAPERRRAFAALLKGKRYRFLAYQHAEMVGTSYKLMKEMTRIAWQTYGAHMRTALVLMQRINDKRRLPARWRRLKPMRRKRVPSTQLNTRYGLFVRGVGRLSGMPSTVVGRMHRCKNPVRWRPRFPAFRKTATHGRICFRIAVHNGKHIARPVSVPLCGRKGKAAQFSTKKMRLRAVLEGGMTGAPTVSAGRIAFSPHKYRFFSCLYTYIPISRKTLRPR